MAKRILNLNMRGIVVAVAFLAFMGAGEYICSEALPSTPECPDHSVVVCMLFDYWYFENSWDIISSSGETVLSSELATSQFEVTGKSACLASDSYTLRMWDLDGDGIEVAEEDVTAGVYLYVNGDLIAYEYDFGFEKEVPFHLCEPFSRLEIQTISNSTLVWQFSEDKIAQYEDSALLQEGSGSRTLDLCIGASSKVFYFEMLEQCCEPVEEPFHVALSLDGVVKQEMDIDIKGYNAEVTVTSDSIDVNKCAIFRFSEFVEGTAAEDSYGGWDLYLDNQFVDLGFMGYNEGGRFICEGKYFLQMFNVAKFTMVDHAGAEILSGKDIDSQTYVLDVKRDGTIVLEEHDDACASMKIVVVPDAYPGEVSWEITNLDNVIFSGRSAKSLNHTVLLCDGNDYLFKVYDEWEDGLCCEFGSGYVELSSGSTTRRIDGQYSAGFSLWIDADASYDQILTFGIDEPLDITIPLDSRIDLDVKLISVPFFGTLMLLIAAGALWIDFKRVRSAAKGDIEMMGPGQSAPQVYSQ